MPEPKNKKLYEEVKTEIQKQMQSMPGQQKQMMEYYQKNPSAIATLRGSLYEEKIINLIKEKSKRTIKKISIKQAEELIKDHHKSHDHSHTNESENKDKTVKSKKKTKKIRKK